MQTALVFDRAPSRPSSPSSSTGQVQEDLSKVIEGGYCVGCGGCASVSNAPTQMRLNGKGMYEAVLKKDASVAALSSACAVCPFSHASLNEDQLGKALFQSPRTRHHEALGSYLACYAGHVEEGDFRAGGSSGGLASWLQCQLLQTGLVDHVINVKPASGSAEGEEEVLFRYTVCSSVEQVRQSAKSRYYPIEMSEVMRRVRETPGRYAFVGLPCYVKTARLLCRQDPVLRQRLKFFIGLVCGHLKSKRFAEFFGWQLGVHPSQLQSFDFRKKLSHRSADDYGVEARQKGTPGDAGSRVEAVRSLDGGDWGRGYFKYKACDFCDDVLAETADVVVGDAWLPAYAEDWRGTNVVVVRHPEIQALLERARIEGCLHLDDLAPEDVARSQDAGLRHRRDGLRYRLHLREKLGEWVPKKRVTPSERHLSRWEQKRQHLREALRDASHEGFAEALQADDLEVFSEWMEPLVNAYSALNAPRKGGRLRRWGRRLRDCGSHVMRGFLSGHRNRLAV